VINVLAVAQRLSCQQLWPPRRTIYSRSWRSMVAGSELQDILLANLTIDQIGDALKLNGVYPEALLIQKNTCDQAIILADGMLNGSCSNCPVCGEPETWQKNASRWRRGAAILRVPVPRIVSVNRARSGGPVSALADVPVQAARLLSSARGASRVSAMWRM
jgi:hypothetical protein